MSAKITDQDVLSPEELEQLPTGFIYVERRLFRLSFYKRVVTDWALARRIRIALGAIKYETPTGPYIVKAKARHPDWYMPNSDWVPEELRGTTVPGGDPANPIKECFLKLTDDGIGIHGTDDLKSLGTKASHGCIRVAPKNAIYLYNHVMPGDNVYIR